MAEAIHNYTFNEPYWHRAERFATERGGALFGATRTQVLKGWDEGKWQELLIGAGAGYAVKHGVTFGLSLVGVEGLPAAAIAGTVSGAVVSTLKELRRAGNLNDYGRVFRGAAVGAVGGLIGYEIHDFINPILTDHNPIAWVGEQFNKLGTNIHDHLPGATPPETATTIPTGLPTEVAAQPTAIPKPSIEPTAVPKPGVPTPEPQTPPPGIPRPPEPVPVPLTPDIAAKVDLFEKNQALNKAVASRVGFHLAAVPETSPLYSQTQHILEEQAYDSKLHALRQVLIDHPDLDVSKVSDLKFASDAVKATFDQDYAKYNLESVVQNFAHPVGGSIIEVGVPPVSTHEVAQTVNNFVELNHGNHELFVDHVVARGETAGRLLQEMGVTPTWDGQDLQGFVTLAVSNPDTFKDIASGLGMSTEDFLKLLQEAQRDPAAAQKIYHAMSLIKTGVHIKLPTRLVMEEINRRFAFGS